MSVRRAPYGEVYVSQPARLAVRRVLLGSILGRRQTLLFSKASPLAEEEAADLPHLEGAAAAEEVEACRRRQRLLSKKSRRRTGASAAVGGFSNWCVYVCMYV